MMPANQCLSVTRSVCPECGEVINANIVSDGKNVYLRKCCPRHSSDDILISANLQWYLKTINSLQFSETSGPRKPVQKGCPHDCGLCSWHETSCTIPVFSVTNACNLDCPICFTYNRPDKMYYMSKEEMGRIVENLISDFGEMDLINITGGEPTMHPNLAELLKIAKRPEIGRITVNSNGLNLARDEDLVRELAGLGAYVILSFNTLDAEVSRKMHGENIVDIKLQAMEYLEKHNVSTTLLAVAVKGLNDHELGKLADMVMTKDFLRSFTVQNMTYTGQGGSCFGPVSHITVDEVIECLTTSKINLKQDDFRAHPRSHPLCYSTCYVISDGQGNTLPMARLLSEEDYAALLSGGYLLHPEQNLEDRMNSAVNRLWAEGASPQTLKIIKDLIKEIYPLNRPLTVFERQQAAENRIKTIYIHSHMDAYNLDLGRLCRCGDLVPQSDGRYLPACSYNIFYRKQDSRFWREEGRVSP
ncbi:MAG: hypothetical protein CVU89_04575 [Firmicutes bacterium HGW-Firmicutes-14]|nr:MAG: hypothetical protein CVU89_04575 [Firmicutes bacterium HGW-Firmicutes-14]